MQSAPDAYPGTSTSRKRRERHNLARTLHEKLHLVENHSLLTIPQINAPLAIRQINAHLTILQINAHVNIHQMNAQLTILQIDAHLAILQVNTHLTIQLIRTSFMQIFLSKSKHVRRKSPNPQYWKSPYQVTHNI